MAVGIIILIIASILRGWGGLNHKRGPMEAALIASGSILAITIISIILALIGSILIGSDSSFWGGLIAFIVFWFLSGIWESILISLGL
ncbi:MAG: hypothetical protein PVG39_15385 [Desulfobacteraceae bacterium]|jgi:hypothetical protein